MEPQIEKAANAALKIREALEALTNAYVEIERVRRARKNISGYDTNYQGMLAEFRTMNAMSEAREAAQAADIWVAELVRLEG